MTVDTNRDESTSVVGGLASVDGVEHYRIEGLEHMEPFLMSVVSDCDLWMFVSSTTALTAGRVDRDNALFPYETDDRLHRAAGVAGPVTVVARARDGRRQLCRPLGPDVDDGCTLARFACFHVSISHVIIPHRLSKCFLRRSRDAGSSPS